MLTDNQELKQLIRKLWDRLWAGGIANPLTAIEQISYLLFMKRLDDLETEREKNNPKSATRFKGNFPEDGGNDVVPKSSLRWSNFGLLPEGERFVLIQEKVFPFLRSLNGETGKFAQSMKNAQFDMRNPSLLKEAMDQIDGIYAVIDKERKNGNRAFQDIQGDVYEMLLKELSQAGKNGQFRTPRHIINLMAELLRPKAGNKIGDPACGSSGFLLGAFQHIVSQEVAKKGGQLDEDPDGFKRALDSSLLGADLQIIGHNLRGFDIDPTMVRIGLMNLMMHGIDDPQVEYMDTLSKSYDEQEDGTYDVIMANPPFAGNIDKTNQGKFEIQTSKSELLFLERIFRMLKKGGKAAVIVPQGVLSSSSKAFVETRKMLLEQSELMAVITMPSGVFKPYAGVSTAILVFTKGEKTERVWYFDMKADGRTLDDKRKETKESDLMDIVEQFKNRFEPDRSTAKHFLVNKEKIVEQEYDLGINGYNIEIKEEITFDAPAVTLQKLKDLEDEINHELTELTKLLVL